MHNKWLDSGRDGLSRSLLKQGSRQTSGGSACSFGKKMKLSWREAVQSDLDLLSEWNHQLISDEGHRNPMTVEQLSDRMADWIQTTYRAIIFSDVEPVGYALFRTDESGIYLRQLFVRRDRRRSGIGRAAVTILLNHIWPSDVRLTVDVLCDNRAAVEFWRAVGYRDYCLTLEIEPRNHNAEQYAAGQPATPQ